MNSTNLTLQGHTPELLQAYDESEKDFRVQQAKLGCILVLFCMPLGMGLDWFVYPDYLVKFLIFGRLLCDVPVLVLYLLLLRPVGRRHIRIIDKIWPALPAISISWMIYMTEGSKSPYYAGLNLVLIVACLLMPYTLWEAIFVCTATLVTYLIACIAYHVQMRSDFDTSILYNNAYFISITALICVSSCFYNRKRRVQEYSLRKELDQRNQELSQLDRLKSEFFANVSHELRTPLTLILAPANVLMSEPEKLSEPVRRALDIVRNNSLRLLKLITDLLEIVRLDQRNSNLKLQPIDLTAFTRATLDSVRHLSDQKSLQLSYSGVDNAIQIKADSNRLEKVMLNLLSNAIKFTSPGGRINVNLYEENGSAVLAVEDNGTGIPARELPYIFERFRQADGSSTRKYQGMGIGLAIARELVLEHKGSLSVSSEEHKGTVFTVRLPRENQAVEINYANSANGFKAVPDAIEQIYHDADRTLLNPHAPLDWDELSSVQGHGKHSIIVIEDEPDLRRFVVSLLTNHYQVRQAADGQRGLDAVEAYRPDLIVLDLMLPEIDGLQVCKLIKENPKLSQTRILLLSARADDQSRLTALRNGADDFLCKPFSSEELTTRIANLIHSAELERDVRNRNDELALALEKLKATETQLVQSEKMNAVGQLSAGILHEINNPLNAAMMAAKVAGKKNADPHVAECITDIHSSMQRILAITNDLRSFAHPNEKVYSDIFTIESAVQTARTLLSHELSGTDLLRVELGNESVQGNKNQIVHVLINLITNAIQAIKVSAKRAKPVISISTLSDGTRLSVIIEDNGPGIPSENITRVMEPFYTTQDVGQGMGLGLSICHTIIKKHGGNLKIESVENQFTRVIFDLPLAMN